MNFLSIIFAHVPCHVYFPIRIFFSLLTSAETSPASAMPAWGETLLLPSPEVSLKAGNFGIGLCDNTAGAGFCHP